MKTITNTESLYQGYIIEIRTRENNFTLIIDGIHFQSEDDRKLRTYNSNIQVIDWAKNYINSL